MSRTRGVGSHWKQEIEPLLTLPVIRWGKPYASLETEEVIHFATGQTVARVGQAGGGLLRRDMRRAWKARDVLRQIPCQTLFECCARAADLYLTGTLTMGDGTQSPDEFVHAQSASTGLPEHMARSNMQKNAFVLENMAQIIDALTRGLDPSILSRGHGEEDRGVTVSYQAQSPVLGAVLPSNSPGVHTLWLPAIPLQLGLVLKPGAREPWTPFRIVAAFVQAGVPAEAMSIYPGAGGDVGAALLATCPRSMVFGDQNTVDQYRGDPRVQAHGPGFSKILLGDDVVDDWEQYLDLMVESVLINGGRSCINCSSIRVSRHSREIAQALAQRLGPIDVKPHDDPEAALAAFTVPRMAQGIWSMLEKDLAEEGVTDVTRDYGPRLVERESCAYLRPVVAHCPSPDRAIATREYMFPFTSVVECPQNQMIDRAGPTLVCTAITGDEQFIQNLGDATHIDRLNIGPIPTNRINWLQPHEGNLMEFLFRSRAYQIASLS
jgi:acyl-CoA reductase-like NAD-dependent aldehyde dehydrogenase